MESLQYVAIVSILAYNFRTGTKEKEGIGLTEQEIEKAKKHLREVVNAMLKYSNKSQNDGARIMGWVNQQMSEKLSRGSLKAYELFYLIDKLGCEIKITTKNGFEADKYKRGHGERVRMMIDKVTYDTQTSHAISNSFYADGVNEYNDGVASELYLDKDGRYFIAKYNESGESTIEPLTEIQKKVGKKLVTVSPEEQAAEFISKYGAYIEKEPGKNQV